METYFQNMTPSEGTKEKLVQDLMTLVHDAEDLIKATGGELADKSRQDLMAALERVKTSCRRLEANAMARAALTDRLIRSNPYPSISMAFGLGMVLGVLLKRR